MDDAGARHALADRVTEAIRIGMMHAVWAEVQPDRVAVYELSGRTRTFGALNANANRIVRLLRAEGLQPGDAVALVCTNRFEFVEVLSAVMRTGMRVTPVNWHLTAEEIAYVVKDCEAKALFADTRVPTCEAVADLCPDLSVKVAIGGELPGFLAYDTALADLDGTDIPDPSRGYPMLYTSGTTGRPKGVFKPDAPAPVFDPARDRANELHICTGPAYHAAPLMGDVRGALTNGVGLVFMDKWDSETVLRTIQDYRVTHGHFVPIMFQRLLALPQTVRAKYDLSSLKQISHGAAPCPPEIKRAIIEWLGPVLREYYAGSEGGAGFVILSEEWLRKPGSVGRRISPDAAKILDDTGEECPAGVAGAIYLKLAEVGAFEYYKDPTKTHSARRGNYFTMGDVGYLDADDYLFLTGRSAETIISGGVNIYPQEVDNELIKHPGVEDCCTIGAPNDEWGEEVRSVIQLKAGYEPSETLKQEILDHARAGLARFKIPREIDFVFELPRSEAGKVQRKTVRERYWQGRVRQI
jgi:long-chain acyl-CoA synthetase